MDKNIAAILRNDTKTVSVTFAGGTNKCYTYVTNLDFDCGDLAIVQVSGDFKVVQIDAVAPDLRIPPNSDIQFKWIVAKVDLTEYKRNMARNEEIENTLSQAYQKAMRDSMAKSVLSGLPDEVRAAVTPLLG